MSKNIKKILFNYGFVPNDGTYPEEWSVLKNYKDKIYVNKHPDPICQMVRPYIYIDKDGICFAINIPHKPYIDGFIFQMKKHSLKDKLSFLIDTWAIDMCMDLWFNDLTDSEKKEVYLENRKRKEYDFEDYDKKFGKCVTKSKSKKKDKELIIYRGVATKSNKKRTGQQSWTTDLEQAEFFAKRFIEEGEKGERYILKGKCKESDILNAYDSEDEVLILAENVKILEKIKVKYII